MFRKVLIANRGEIAVRVIRTLREMGIASVAVFSDADREAPFVNLADEAFRLGPPPASESYLNIEALVSIASQSGAGAVHPGYGFLAENAGFAQAVADAGIAFIGPSPASIRLMGDKLAARRAVSRLGVPVVPGTTEPVQDAQEAIAFGRESGYPVAVKAAGGGGGRGIRVVRDESEMREALERASREAETYFKNPEVYLERYYPDPRHVEIQVIGDGHGHLLHLGERDCSIQRRHQKLIEETPSPVVDRAMRERIGDLALKAAQAADYYNAGTVEFLVADGEVFFLEMNTRVQVEHPVTEAVSGVDIIRQMVLVAGGEPLEVTDSLLEPFGHALEVRVNAEDPGNDFRPTPVTIDDYREPGGPGVRLDSGVAPGFTIPDAYDSLMSKVICWAPDRRQAIQRMRRALGEYQISGPASTILFADAVLAHPLFTEGRAPTTFVERHLDELVPKPSSTGITPRQQERLEEARLFDVEVDRRRFQVRVAEVKGRGEEPRGKRRKTRVGAQIKENAVVSPMPGTVLRVRKGVGDAVEVGEPLFTIEAMKMENEVQAHRAGAITSIDVEVGATVDANQQLATIS